VSQIDLTAKKQTVEFGSSQEAWQILKPRPLRADKFFRSKIGAPSQGRQDGICSGGG